jgi:hypothetical protein
MSGDRIYDTVLGEVRLSTRGKVSFPAGIELPPGMPPICSIAAGGNLVAMLAESRHNILVYRQGQLDVHIWDCPQEVEQVACCLNNMAVLFTSGQICHTQPSFFVDLPRKAVALRAGEAVWAAILDDGAVYTWGAQRGRAQLGREGDNMPRRVQVPPIADLHFSALHFAAAITTAGVLYLWGGHGGSPPILGAQGPFARLAVARRHVMAVYNDLRRGYAWGDFGKPTFSARQFTITQGTPVTNVIGSCFSGELYVECTRDAIPHYGPRRLLDMDLRAERVRQRMPVVQTLLAPEQARQQRRRARPSTEKQRPFPASNLLPRALWRVVISFI